VLIPNAKKIKTLPFLYINFAFTLPFLYMFFLEIPIAGKYFWPKKAKIV